MLNKEKIYLQQTKSVCNNVLILFVFIKSSFNNYRLPFRRDRVGDSHGGIAVYAKENIIYKRRHDLELNTIECIWLKLNIKNKKNYLLEHFIDRQIPPLSF